MNVYKSISLALIMTFNLLSCCDKESAEIGMDRDFKKREDVSYRCFMGDKNTKEISPFCWINECILHYQKLDFYGINEIDSFSVDLNKDFIIVTGISDQGRCVSRYKAHNYYIQVHTKLYPDARENFIERISVFADDGRFNRPILDIFTTFGFSGHKHRYPKRVVLYKNNKEFLQADIEFSGQHGQ